MRYLIGAIISFLVFAGGLYGIAYMDEAITYKDWWFAPTMFFCVITLIISIIVTGVFVFKFSEEK